MADTTTNGNGKTVAGFFLNLAKEHGVSVLAAAYLIYWLTTSVTTLQTRTLDALREHDGRMQLIQKSLEEESQRAWIQIGIQQQTCLRLSKTDSERDRCTSLRGPEVGR